MDSETTLTDIIARHGFEITASARSRRTDRAATQWDKEAIHFWVTLTKPFRPRPDGKPYQDKRVLVWEGFYSVGSIYPLHWAKKAERVHKVTGKLVPHDRARHLYHSLQNKSGFGKITLHDERIRQDIRALYEAAAPLTVEQVLESLIMDARGSDQPFADWAGDLGYSDDSIKAKAIWEVCNDIRRALMGALGADWDIAEELEI